MTARIMDVIHPITDHLNTMPSTTNTMIGATNTPPHSHGRVLSSAWVYLKI